MVKNTLWKEVEAIASWSGKIEIMRERLHIPDMSTRSGLRKIHQTFPDIYKRLSTCYNENTKHKAVQAAVVSIYARMCVDSLLRNKLASESGFYPQIIPLLNFPNSRLSALQCLVMITHHGGINTRYQLARYTSDLIKLAQDNIDNPSVTEPCAIIISHNCTAVLCPGDQPVDQKALKSMGSLSSILIFIDTLVRNPATTFKAYSHMLGFLTDASQNAQSAFLSHPKSISLMVATLRSKDIQTRVSALGGILRLHLHNADNGRSQPDPNVIMANVQTGIQLPDSSTSALAAYGMERSDLTLMLSCLRDHQNAMMKFVQTHDYYALGMKLFQLIGRTEFSLADGIFGDEHGRPIEMGLPFAKWVDAMPHCANAIREKGKPSEADAANVVELKYFILRARYKELRALCPVALKNSPTVAFYYYAMSLGSEEHEDALRWAKKGLKCTGPTMTPYVRFGLLYSAIMNAGLMGIEYMTKAARGESAWEDAYTFLRVGLEDAKTFIAEAPPDSRNMSSAILWCILFTVTLRGSDLSNDLREIQPLLKKLKISDEIQSWMLKGPVSNSQIRLAQETIMKYYASGAAEWGSLISHFDAMEQEPENGLILPRPADVDLADWLNGTKLDDDEEEDHHHSHHAPVYGDRSMELYKCAHCGNPSVMLKKCTRCLKAKYCDSSCQKMNWSEHKKTCKAPTAS